MAHDPESQVRQPLPTAAATSAIGRRIQSPLGVARFLMTHPSKEIGRVGPVEWFQMPGSCDLYALV